jgi:hypothetical protein
MIVVTVSVAVVIANVAIATVAAITHQRCTASFVAPVALQRIAAHTIFITVTSIIQLWQPLIFTL